MLNPELRDMVYDQENLQVSRWVDRTRTPFYVAGYNETLAT